MAKSTGIVVTAGGVSMVDLIMTGYDSRKALRIGVATIAAALISAGLDKVLPGFGTGAAAILLLSVLLKSGPAIAARTGFTT